MTKDQLRNEIISKIYENTSGAITGQELQNVLLDMVETLWGAGGSGQDGVGIRDIVITDIVYSSVSPMRALRSDILGAGGGESTGKRITIYLTDGTTKSFDIYNGKDGEDGQDGSGSGTQGPAGPSGPQGPMGPSDEELFHELEEEFDRYKEELSGRIETIKSQLEDKVNGDVGNAMNELYNTQQELSNMADRLNAAAQNASDALALARSLSGMTGSGITPEQIEEILRLNQEVYDWMQDFSGKVSTLMTDYDDLNTRIGAIGIGLDTVDGKVGLLTTNLNTLSGTVGTVKTEWDASKGSLTNLANWYNQSAGTYAELVRQMDGMNARITDRISYYMESGGGATFLESTMDAKLAQFRDTLEISGVDLTHIERRIDGLSASVITEIERYNTFSGELVTINHRMDGLNAQIETSLTKAESALTSAHSLREIWDANSGIIRTVSDLVARVDENGEPYYWYIDPELEDKSDNTKWVRVFYAGSDPDTGLPYYVYDKDNPSYKPSEPAGLPDPPLTSNVFPDYMASVVSYIAQQSDSIELNVSSGDITSALRLEVVDGGSRIYLTADRIMLDGEVWARSIVSSGANIGGIHLGDGVISAGTGNNHWSIDGNGNLEAQNAKIHGAISATSLTLGTAATNSIKNVVTANSVSSAVVKNYVTDFVGSQGFLTNAALNGYVSQQDLDEWVDAWNASHSANPLTSADVQTIAERVVGAELSSFVSDVENPDGSITRTMNVGGTEYTWTIYDAGDYMLFGTWKGSSSSAGTGFMVSKNGLLTANNALIYGTVYASAGRFQGDITANSLTLGTDASAMLHDMIVNEIPDSGDGLNEQEVNDLIASAANAYNWVIQEDLGDYLKLGTNYGTVSSVTISKQGLLVANNAIISGTVYANSGVFNGTIHANDGYFKGSVSASSGYFNNVSANNITIKNSDFTGDITANSLTLGTVAENTVKGVVTANSVSSAVVKNYINSQNFLNSSALNGYITEADIKAWANNQGWQTQSQVQALINAISGAEVSVVSSTTVNPDGSIHHSLIIGGKPYEWDTLDAGGVLLLGENYTDAEDVPQVTVMLSANSSSEVVIKLSSAPGSAVTVFYRASMDDNYLYGGTVDANSTTGYLYTCDQDEYITGANVDRSALEDDDYVIYGAYLIVEGNLNKKFVYKKSTVLSIYNEDDVNGTVLYTPVNKYRFCVSKNGLLQANNAVIYGKIYASEGYFSGKITSHEGRIGGLTINSYGLSGNNFSVTRMGVVGSGWSLTTSGLVAHNAEIYGSIRQPFGHLTQTGVNAGAMKRYDNVYFDSNTESGVIVWDLDEEQEEFGLLWDTTQIGRRITIVNNRGGKQITDYGYSKLIAPSGYYFFEDGIGTNNLMFSNEIIELLGYGESDNNVFYGYIVMNRRNMMTKKRYGHELRMLATGTIKSGTNITNLTCFDGTKFISASTAMAAPTGSTTYYFSNDFSRISCRSIYINANRNNYEVRLPSKWFKSMSQSDINKKLRIQFVPRGDAYTVASFISGNTSGFVYTTAVGLSYAPADVDFYIYNMGDWDCLAEDASLELTSDRYTVTWDQYNSTGSTTQFNISVSPSNATISTAITNSNGQVPFSLSWNATSKRLTATLNSTPYQDAWQKVRITATAGSETASIDLYIRYEYYIPPCNADT